MPRVYDVPAVEALVAADREDYPHEGLVVIDTDDGVPYGDMAAVMDLTKGYGCEMTLLAGGPARSAYSGMVT